MARIAGVDLPRRKRLEVALTYIYGVGNSLSQKILETTGIDGGTRVQDLTEEEVRLIRNLLDADYTVEGDLRREIQGNIKRLKDLNCYRGIRHRKGLPVRGQRTRTNARGRRGPRRAMVRKRS